MLGQLEMMTEARVPRIAAPGGANRQAHQLWEKRYWFASVLVSGIAMVGAWVAGGGAWFAYQEAARQAAAAEGQLAQGKMSNRPYLLLAIEDPGVSHDWRVVDGGRGVDAVHIGFRFVNYGATPAIVKSLRYSLDKVEDFEVFDGAADYEAGLGLASGAATGLLKADSGAISPTDLDQLVALHGNYYFRGQISYTDIADTPHETRFCYNIRSPAALERAEIAGCSNDRN